MVPCSPLTSANNTICVKPDETQDCPITHLNIVNRNAERTPTPKLPVQNKDNTPNREFGQNQSANILVTEAVKPNPTFTRQLMNS